MTQHIDEYTEPPEDVRRELERTLTLHAASARSIADTLEHLDEFLRRHASPLVQAELRTFCTAQGWSPICGTDAFVDRIGLHALALRHALDTTTDHADEPVGAEHDQESA